MLKSTEFGVLGLIHYLHPTTTQLLHHAVVRNGLADHAQACYGGSLYKSMKAGELREVGFVVWRFTEMKDGSLVAAVLKGDVMSIV
jgi:hypothetical protein